MDSARVERLAAAVATMPDGPSRERFVVLLAELNEAEPETVDTDRDDTDPGDVIRDGIGGVEDPPAFEDPFDATLTAPVPDVAEVVEATYVPQPPEQVPPTTPADEQTKKRRWRRKD